LDGTFAREILTRDVSELPPGDLLIHVSWSSLNFNYKDALVAVGRRGVARGYPITPGIDAAGVVEESSSGDYAPGENVIVCGRDLGISVPGGFGQYSRIPAAWALKQPAGITLRESMVIGTAGFAAALSIKALQEHGLSPQGREVLVTGATGGVGSFAVAILSKLGYRVAAGTGKTDQERFLTSLGAKETIPRVQLDDTSARRFSRKDEGVIDTVGGGVLSTAIRSTAYSGSVAAFGNAASPDLPLTVFPFILRGVRLLGIDSARCPTAVRQELWERLAGSWKPARLDDMASECSLEELNARIEAESRGEW
jgi:putative YhdH/YhfP family quinone oxidoreductase